nr:MAG TPA: hypothetical protein [Caudoviricetes sp.]
MYYGGTSVNAGAYPPILHLQYLQCWHLQQFFPTVAQVVLYAP